jgi:hypothetical protein
VIFRRAVRGVYLMELENVCRVTCGFNPEQARWHVLRLLKYHYLILELQGDAIPSLSEAFQTLPGPHEPKPKG